MDKAKRAVSGQMFGISGLYHQKGPPDPIKHFSIFVKPYKEKGYTNFCEKKEIIQRVKNIYILYKKKKERNIYLYLQFFYLKKRINEMYTKRFRKL